jgi:cytidine deaminase
MKELKFETCFMVYNSVHELNDDERHLMNKAMEALPEAYAPYSKFHVGAAVLMEDGKMLSGTNQENASFPIGLCAERVALAAVASIYPSKKIRTIAVTIKNFNKPTLEPVSPCGTCRQTLLEKEQNNDGPIRILLKGEGELIYALDTVSSLLPLSFGSKDLK